VNKKIQVINLDFLSLCYWLTMTVGNSLSRTNLLKALSPLSSKPLRVDISAST
jgi:hypothetical protein